jgi:hypothetical protein
MMACTGPAPNPAAKLARDEVLAARAATRARAIRNSDRHARRISSAASSVVSDDESDVDGDISEANFAKLQALMSYEPTQGEDKLSNIIKVSLHHKNVGAFATTTSRASLQAIKHHQGFSSPQELRRLRHHNIKGFANSHQRLSSPLRRSAPSPTSRASLPRFPSCTLCLPTSLPTLPRLQRRCKSPAKATSLMLS